MTFPSDPHTIDINFQQATDKAKCGRIRSQMLRRLSAQTWQRIRFDLGAAILGHLPPSWSAATKFYLDPHESLFENAFAFPAPPSLLTVKERCQKEAERQKLQRLIERLDERKRATLLSVAEGLAG